MSEALFRKLPAVHAVLGTEAMQSLGGNISQEATTAAIRDVLDDLRQRVRSGAAVDGEMDAAAVARRAIELLQTALRPRLRRVINATGIVLHTNLGRAPMAEAAALAAADAARGYLNLELDLATGKRSSRQDAIREWVCRLTGAESATAVNNNAAATVIVLRALAQGKEVIISRGQLIEIGGCFRIPDIMAVSGAILREVGTTNITRLSDYQRAIGSSTGAILEVHTSNYRIRGFTESAALADLVALAHKHGLPVIDDLGSGALVDFRRFGFEGEPIPHSSIAAGADVILFSGDKLLGGPQAGIIAGRKEWIQKIEKDPLMRAFRLDKMTLAALEATLRLYLNEEQALRDVPVLRLLGTPLQELRSRAKKLAGRLAALEGIAEAVPAEDVAFAGGGSLPDQPMKTWCVEVQAAQVSDAELARRLRVGDPAVMARVRDGKVILDVRTIFPQQEGTVIEAVTAALSAASDGGGDPAADSAHGLDSPSGKEEMS
jgi:L-seryl-tRNA(Ser) seleniumtransferase